MCKFETPSATGYGLVAAAIMRYTNEASGIIETRWVKTKKLLSMLRASEAAELLG
jgi:hypothetical protein